MGRYIRMQAKLQRDAMALHQLSLQAARQTREHYTTSTGLRQYSFGIGGEPASRLEYCVARIKDLRQQRKALLKRKVELQKKARTGAGSYQSRLA